MRYLNSIAWIVLSLCLVTKANGQAVLNQQILGQGGYSSNFVDVFSGAHNQSSLSEIKHFSAGVFVNQRFSMKALSAFHLGINIPMNVGAVSIQGEMAGFEKFKRQKWALGYALPLFRWLDIGASLDYLRMNVPAYGDADAFTFSLSGLIHIQRKWHIGFQAFNPGKVHYRKLGKEEITDIYQLGVGYQPSAIFLLTTEIRFTEGEESVLLGFRYRLAKVLSLSVGVSTGVNPISAGVQLHWKKYQVLLSASYHKQLGLTPGAGIIYENLPPHDF